MLVSIQQQVKIECARPPSLAIAYPPMGLFQLLQRAPMHIDELIRESGMDGAAVARALSIMEVGGMVEHIGSMRWTVMR